jgi:DNA-binding protein YbaB
MTDAVPGASSLVSYILTGSRHDRTAYRALPEAQHHAYYGLVNTVFSVLVSYHFGGEFLKDDVDRLIRRVAERHPQYGGGVKRVLRSLVTGEDRRSELSAQQMRTAQHLVIRELAKMYPNVQANAEQIVAQAAMLNRLIEQPRPGAPAPAPIPEPEPEVVPRPGGDGPIGGDAEITKLGSELADLDREYLEMRSALAAGEFTGSDAAHLASVTLGHTGALRRLEFRSGIERKGGRSVSEAIVSAWNIAERERARGAEEFNRRYGVTGSYDPSVLEPTSVETYSESGACRVGVDRHGRLSEIVFFTNDLFATAGREGLAAEVAAAIRSAQSTAASSGGRQ